MSAPVSTRGWVRPMTARDTGELHRASTPIELFFDLCFVVAVAAAAGELHHYLAEGKVADGLLSYAMVFFAIWWAWMNVTWFASAYDNDDVAYRLAMFVQITGALILAAGVPRAFEQRDFVVVTIGYVVMRISLVGQWLRAARNDPTSRRSCLRYAAAISICQVGWIALLFLPNEAKMPGFIVMVLAEVFVPVWAERVGPTPWHRGHIAERFALFTLIVLGEAVTSASIAIGAAVQSQSALRTVAPVVVGGLLLVFSMWWMYFARPAGDTLNSARRVFEWGYGHLLIFASLAAVGAGIALAIEHLSMTAGSVELEAAHVSDVLVGAAVTIPVSLFLLTTWWLHLRPHDTSAKHGIVNLAGVILLLAATFSSQPVLIAGALFVAILVVNMWLERGEPVPV